MAIEMNVRGRGQDGEAGVSWASFADKENIAGYAIVCYTAHSTLLTPSVSAVTLEY